MIRRKTVLAVMAVLPMTWLLAGCGDKPASKKSSTTPPKIDEGTTPPEGSAAKGKGESQSPAVEGWGTIKGRIVYDGDPPEPTVIAEQGAKVLKAEPDKELKNWERCSMRTLVSEDLVVSKENKGIKWVVVSIGGNPKPPAELAKAEGEVEFGQEFCQFKTHVLALREGQKLIVTAGDPGVGHNTNLGGSVNPTWNVMIPTPKEGEKSRVDGPDLRAERKPIQVNCNVHGWMKAYIAVFKHPYFAVTGDDGSFEIPKVPAGKQKLVVWQEVIGQSDREIEVKADETTDVGEIKLVKQ